MISNELIFRARPAFRRLAAAAVVVTLLAGCSSDDAEVAVEDATDQVAEATEDAAAAVDEDAEELVEDVATEVDEAVEGAADEIDERSAAIVQALRDNNLESLASAVEQVDANELLGDGEFTLFAPNDEAFLELGADQTADLLSNPAELNTVLQNHVVTEQIDSTELAGSTEVQTRGGNTLTVTVSGDTVMVGDATVVNADIEAADGIIHVVDSVLVP